VTVTVSGMPAGWSLNQGSNNGGGTWTVQHTDPSALTVTTASGFVGATVLNVSESWTNAGDSAGSAFVRDNVEASAPGAPIFAVSGDDTLTGSAGSDRIAFAQPIGHDTIYNFSAAADAIDLIGFNPYGLLFDEFTASSLIKIDAERKKVEPSETEINSGGSRCRARCTWRGQKSLACSTPTRLCRLRCIDAKERAIAAQPTCPAGDRRCRLPRLRGDGPKPRRTVGRAPAEPRGQVRSGLRAGGDSHERTRLWSKFPASRQNTGKYIESSPATHPAAAKTAFESTRYRPIPYAP
jgi:hypothetical protein